MKEREMIGSRITALATQTRRYPVDFPGWGHPGAADFLLDIPAGLAGKVVGEESHGSRPWTRYGVRFDDGTRAYGLILGRDFEVVAAAA